jgi:hypothetical protein
MSVAGPQARARSCVGSLALAGRLSRRGILGNDGSLLLILANNYNRTTNDLTTGRHRAHKGRTETTH